MKITKIEVNNYRLLKKFSLKVDENLSLIVGKNNTGKTSLLHILQKFLQSTSNSFNFEDFHLDTQDRITKLIAEKQKKENNQYDPCRLELKIYIERNVSDNLENIRDLILDLDPQKTTTLLTFEYILDFDNYLKLCDDFHNSNIKNSVEYLKKSHRKYFQILRKVVDVQDPTIFIEIDDSKIKKIINVKAVSAKRDVLNEDGDNNKSNRTLSKLSYKYFRPFEDSNSPHITSLQEKLIETDASLTQTYADIFKKVTDDINIFSYGGASKISVKSNFQEINALRENTTVSYEENGFDLPEDYNGLGYMNLFAMIFELNIIFDDFHKIHSDSDVADINLLFIEEPEAHTHPQLQYVFIKNVKKFLTENAKSLNLQTLITTHSAHIVSQSDFDNIKYFLNEGVGVVSKDLTSLEHLYGDEKENFNFLKKYLTLNSSELFFSDKVIFIEGDSERILLPAMMKKIDLTNAKDENYIPLLSQKISFLEVGAHSQIFHELIDFLEIKSLVITDFDTVKEDKDKNGKLVKLKCPVNEATDISNNAIKHYLKGKTFDELQNIQNTERICKSVKSEIYIAYQSKESNYHARTFEDAFLCLNFNFINNNKNNFLSLKQQKFSQQVVTNSNDYYLLAECIDSKTAFSTDILFYSDETFNNWETPSYIEEGLKWLAK